MHNEDQTRNLIKSTNLESCVIQYFLHTVTLPGQYSNQRTRGFSFIQCALDRPDLVNILWLCTQKILMNRLLDIIFFSILSRARSRLPLIIFVIYSLTFFDFKWRRPWDLNTDKGYSASGAGISI